VGRAAIGSALGPIRRQKEIIVVDHGSTDGTLAGARQFESNEVRGDKQPNQEAAAASVPSAGDKANPAELKDDSEEGHLQELAKRSSRQNRCHPLSHDTPQP
jgi:glycosyltransferase involved in cell wall biosynthesis